MSHSELLSVPLLDQANGKLALQQISAVEVERVLRVAYVPPHEHSQQLEGHVAGVDGWIPTPLEIEPHEVTILFAQNLGEEIFVFYRVLLVKLSALLNLLDSGRRLWSVRAHEQAISRNVFLGSIVQIELSLGVHLLPCHSDLVFRHVSVERLELLEIRELLLLD